MTAGYIGATLLKVLPFLGKKWYHIVPIEAEGNIKINQNNILTMNDKKRKKLPFEKHKDIARIDQEAKKNHGWYVRVRFLGKTHAKFFSDKKYEGRHSSLLSAITWRNKTEKKLGKIRTDRHLVTVSNSSTGVVGVTLNDRLNRYEVSWVNKQGKQGKTTVSIARHGKKKAFSIACSIRQDKEKARLE